MLDIWYGTELSIIDSAINELYTSLRACLQLKEKILSKCCVVITGWINNIITCVKDFVVICKLLPPFYWTQCILLTNILAAACFRLQQCKDGNSSCGSCKYNTRADTTADKGRIKQSECWHYHFHLPYNGICLIYTGKHFVIHHEPQMQTDSRFKILTFVILLCVVLYTTWHFMWYSVCSKFM